MWRRAFLTTSMAAIALLVCQAAAEEPKLTEPKFLLTWGQKGDKPGEFHSPIGIAISPKDEIFVTDLNNARVQKFDTSGKYLGGFDLPLDNPPRKTNLAGGIGLDGDGLIYLSYMGQHKIVVYSEDGKLVREWGKKGAGDGEFYQPGGIVFAKDGTLLVADQCNHRVQRFTRNGEFLGKWGHYGSKPGQFDGMQPAGSRFGGPHFLAIDSRGWIYTTEGMHGRVQQLMPDGFPLRAWGSKGDEPGGFGALETGFAKVSFGPIAVMVDRHDRVWVSSLNDRVQAYTPEGKYLFGINTSGDKPGELAQPHGMAMDSQGHLYVCDAGNQRIQKFEVPGLPGGCEVTLAVNRERILQRDHLVVRAVVKNGGDEVVRVDEKSAGGGVIRSGGHVLYERKTSKGWYPLLDMETRGGAVGIRRGTPTLEPGASYAEYVKFWLVGEKDFIFDTVGPFEFRGVVDTSNGLVYSKPIVIEVVSRSDDDRKRIFESRRFLFPLGRVGFPNELHQETFALEDLDGNIAQGIRDLKFLDSIRNGEKVDDANVARWINRKMKGLDAEIGLLTIGSHAYQWHKWEYLRQIVDSLPYETVSSHGWSARLDQLTPPQFVPVKPTRTPD